MDNKIRMILKFDTGADGFLKMITVLAVGAILVLGIGILFLASIMHTMRQIS